MRLLVRNGHFAFYPRTRVDVLQFRRLFSTLPSSLLFAEDDYYTFIGLLNLPRWSQLGIPYGGFPALLNFEGRHPHEVMRANRLVYSMQTMLLVPQATYATVPVNFRQSRDYILSPKMLIQPGCLVSVDYVPKGILTGYSAEIDLDTQQTTISSIELNL